MFKFEKDLLPDVFKDFFVRNREIHGYATRQTNLLHVPKARINLYQKQLKYTGINLWNYIHDKLNANCTLAIYKCQLKKFLAVNDVPLTFNL